MSFVLSYVLPLHAHTTTTSAALELSLEVAVREVITGGAHQDPLTSALHVPMPAAAAKEESLMGADMAAALELSLNNALSGLGATSGTQEDAFGSDIHISVRAVAAEEDTLAAVETEVEKPLAIMAEALDALLLLSDDERAATGVVPRLLASGALPEALKLVAQNGVHCELVSRSPQCTVIRFSVMDSRSSVHSVSLLIVIDAYRKAIIN